MRVQEEGLPLATRQTVLTILSGVPLPDEMPKKSCMLYRCENKVTFAANMPSFDEWGLRPIGLVGARENPVIVVPFFTAGAELAPGDGAGERAETCAGWSDVEEHMPSGDPGASSSGGSDAPPEAPIADEMSSEGPWEVAARKSRAVRHSWLP